MMTIRQKLEIIRATLGITQTQLALRFGVSFVAFNSWWNEKSIPRPTMQAAIEELFLEVTGQKIIPTETLAVKKEVICKKSSEYKNAVAMILDNPDIRDRLILKLTYHSNRIEGSTLSEPDTAAIIFDNAALPDKNLTEQLEAKNHHTALQFLFNHIAEKKSVNEHLAMKLHSILMNGIQPDAGLYRRHAVRITGTDLVTANYLRIPDLVPAVFTAERGKNKDVIAAIARTHSQFEQIHPFSDGNGRVGRLLMNATLLQANIAPAIIREGQKRLYYTYLYKAQTKDDRSQLENFLCDAVMDGFTIMERMDA